jgi:hypothetical protein
MRIVGEDIDFEALIECELDKLQIPYCGNALGSILALQLDTYDQEEQHALDADFKALGWGMQCWCGVDVSLYVGAQGEQDLEEFIAVVDPMLIVALDAGARQALDSLRWGIVADKCTLQVGQMTVRDGRALIAIDGFKSSLANADEKQGVWAQFKYCGSFDKVTGSDKKS